MTAFELMLKKWCEENEFSYKYYQDDNHAQRLRDQGRPITDKHRFIRLSKSDWHTLVIVDPSAGFEAVLTEWLNPITKSYKRA